jgi:hypothetical protein
MRKINLGFAALLGKLGDKFGKKDYFKILLFDPNHLFYLNERTDKYSFGKEAIC